MSCLCRDISIYIGAGMMYTCVFMFEKHNIGLILRLKRHIFTVFQHIFLCLCVFRNAPVERSQNKLSVRFRLKTYKC
jgi:hypothetical protein